MKLKLYLFLLTIIGIGFGSNIAIAIPSQPLNPSQAKFITVADIHFDPFMGCEKLPRPCALLQALKTTDYKSWDSILSKSSMRIPRYQEDTNYLLLESTLLALQKVNQTNKPQFVLVLGDFLAHSFRSKYKKYSSDNSKEGYTQFVKKTLQFLTYKLNQTFPDTSIYPVVGNNDSYTGNYNVVPNGAFLHDTANTWAVMIKDKNNQQAFLQLFPQGGYYAITLPYNQKILVLDTVLFSSNSRKKAMAIMAKQQLNWLKAQLTLAQNEHSHVILAYHIPVGVDVFTSVKLFLLTLREFWHPQYSREFQQILQVYGDTIVAILPAHIHMDSYQIVPVANIPILFTPSISPVYGNNPGFKVFTYFPETLLIQDYVTYYYPYLETSLGDWKLEYSFNKVYQPDCMHCTIVNGMHNLKMNNRLASYYQQFYAVSKNSLISNNRQNWNPYYWCNINNIGKSNYRFCLRNS
jgi:hypothetical protein